MSRSASRALQLVHDAQTRQFKQDFTLLDKLRTTRALLSQVKLLSSDSTFDLDNENDLKISNTIQECWGIQTHANVYPVIRVSRLPEETFQILCDVLRM